MHAFTSTSIHTHAYTHTRSNAPDVEELQLSQDVEERTNTIQRLVAWSANKNIVTYKEIYLLNRSH
jgi:hypothetical protein